MTVVGRDGAGVGRGQNKPVYPDMKLYQEIIFLKQVRNSNGTDFDGHWVVENVQSYYEPLIPPQKLQRHYFWSNFHIPELTVSHGDITESNNLELGEYLGFDLSDTAVPSTMKKKMLRNCVHPKLGKHILNAVRNADKQTLQGFVH